MALGWFDVSVFVGFFAVAVGTAVYKSRGERTGEDFFLASRSLIWPLIGLSLIAANISTEQIVGQSGQGAGAMGMAVASYEWIATITLVVVALVILPRLLKTGIYTVPEFLEYRYNALARGIMAFYLMVIYVAVSISAVVYTGALTMQTIFGIDMVTATWIIGSVSALYATWGGLKAVAWADLFQGSALLIGGVVTMVLAFQAVGGPDAFFTANADRLHTILPADHPILPWTAMFIGIWIPNLYYWGLNQFITQRALAAKTLAHGQLGVLFAAGLKLIIPFIIIFPGIMASQLYEAELTAPGATADAAYPLLIKNLIPAGMRGFIFAAIAGAVISTLASMLNSVSTILTVDLYKRHWKKDASPESLVTIGRIATLSFVVVVCLIAPRLGSERFHGIFNYIQEFHGYISPGILAAFGFGWFVKRAPSAAGVTGLLLSAPVYGFLQWQYNEIAFLNRQAITLALVVAAMALITLVKPRATPREMPVREDFDMKTPASVKWIGAGLVAATVTLYITFW
jgi:solute:Na+ symporter, SSS family